MERNEISIHELIIWEALVANSALWLSNKEIFALCSTPKVNISARTVRAHTSKLSKLGLIDQAEVFPAHRFRVSEKAGKRNLGYMQRLTKSKEVFECYLRS